MKKIWKISLRLKIIFFGLGTNAILIAGTFYSVNYAMASLYWVMGVVAVLSVGFSVWMGSSLTGAVESITDGFAANSEDLADAAIKIASWATQLSDSTLEQSSALQETVSTVDEINTMIQKNTEAAQKSKEL